MTYEPKHWRTEEARKARVYLHEPPGGYWLAMRQCLDYLAAEVAALQVHKEFLREIVPATPPSAGERSEEPSLALAEWYAILRAEHWLRRFRKPFWMDDSAALRSLLDRCVVSTFEAQASGGDEDARNRKAGNGTVEESGSMRHEAIVAPTPTVAVASSDTPSGAAPSGEMEVFYADSVGAIHPFLSCTNLIRLSDAQERIEAERKIIAAKDLATITKLCEERDEARAERNVWRQEVERVGVRRQEELTTPTPGVVSEEAVSVVWEATRTMRSIPALLRPSISDERAAIRKLLTAAAPFMGQQRREISERDHKKLVAIIERNGQAQSHEAVGFAATILDFLGITPTKPAAEGERT